MKVVQNRLAGLDYLRGLAASGVMSYHFLSWTMGDFKSESIFGRVGIYGVAIFYILSGLTLFHVNHTRMQTNMGGLFDFARKRVFRIFPLLWLVTIAALALQPEVFDLGRLLLNFSGLFGFLEWDAYYATGAWSIGNELVFYSLFPIFLFLFRYSKLGFSLAFLLLIGIGALFAFDLLNADIPLGKQWTMYINPLNQAYLFIGGFALGAMLKEVRVSQIVVFAVFFAGLALFIFYPESGDKINLVTGWSRGVFSLAGLMVCFAFFKLDLKFPKLTDKPLTFLGEISYSLYLLHPIVWGAVGLTGVDVRVRLVVSGILTLALSYCVYEYFEKYFVRLGRRKPIPVEQQVNI